MKWTTQDLNQPETDHKSDKKASSEELQVIHSDVGAGNDNDNDNEDHLLNTTTPHMIPKKNHTKCMLELEQMMEPLIWEWREARIPIPHSVKIINGQFYVLILIHHVSHLEKDLRNARQIFCNDSGGGIILGQRVSRGKPDEIVVRCPAVVNPANSTLSTLSIVTGNGSNNGTTYKYKNLKKLDECERTDIASFEQLEKGKERPVKIGATITIRSSLSAKIEWGNARQHAVEWAEYHHLIGVDHMWIYINEAWNDGMGLPYRDYITWIPYNWCMYNYNNFTRFPDDPSYMELFRGTSQTDAVWRARRTGMDWIAMIDVDEYVRVGPQHLNNNATERCPEGGCITTSTNNEHDNPVNVVGSLSRFLTNLTVFDSPSTVYKDDHNRTFGGIRLESIPYGRNTKIDPKEDTNTINLVIDNVWTEKTDPNHGKSNLGRQKAIIVPHMVLSFYIHHITSSTMSFSCCNGLRQDHHMDEIRVNHYKRAEHGVYWKFKKKTHPGKLFDFCCWHCVPCCNSNTADITQYSNCAVLYIIPTSSIVEKIEKESYLKDNFHDLIIAAIRKDSSEAIF